MKYLITGGAGFIGSHLAGRLLRLGHSVTVVDDFSTGSFDNIREFEQDMPDRFVLVKGSVCDQALMDSLIADCDGVYHLAAAVGVQLILDKPVHTLETNIHGSEVVMKLASEHKKKILIASTSEVYGKGARIPFAEDDDVLLGATRFNRWGYAASKMVDEFLALAYHEEFGLDVIICRFFNTVGPRQTGKYGMVIPRFVEKALRGETVEVYGTGEQSRCFCHVGDVTKAITDLWDCTKAIGQVVNIGSDEEISMNDLAERVIELTGSASKIEHISYRQAYGRDFDDMMVRKPDLTKLGDLIGYKPGTKLDRTLEDVISHFRMLAKM